MKADVKLLSELREKYNHEFKAGEIQFRSFHDLLWQIAINGMLDDENEPCLFHVNAGADYGNEMVIARASGGYIKTGVYFVKNVYGECCDLAEDINEVFFQIDIDEQMELMSKSMFA